MSFHPSPSVDCRTTPMEVVLPFIQKSLTDDDDRANNNGGFLKPLNREDRRRSGESVIHKTCCDYRTDTGQYIFRCPPNGAKRLIHKKNPLWLSQISTVAFYQALLSEFLGTMLLVLICISSGLPIDTKVVPPLHGALVGGFTIATLIVNFGHLSGAHINPAVTVSFLVAGEIDIIRAFCYIGMQLLGATAGSILLKVVVPEDAQGTLGVTMVTEGVSISQAVIIESIITFVLCFTVHAICDKRREDIGGSKALAVGLAISVGALFGGPYTGGSMNPARSFGPATVTSAWKDHWVYWVGPMIGSIVAGVMYNFVLRQRPPIVVDDEADLDDDHDKSGPA